MEVITLKKPILSEEKQLELLKKLINEPAKFSGHITNVNEPKYLYWDKVKYKTAPEGLAPEEFWFLVRQTRNWKAQQTPIKAESGESFIWTRLGTTDEFLHEIDMNTGGQIFAPYEAISERSKEMYVSRGILEEAIASSQLEGAHTTRRAAKKMIIEERLPRNKSEMMILNNYKTMRILEEDYKDKKLSEELLLELHALITNETVPEEEQFRYRKDSDDIVVGDELNIAHIPPKEVFVKKEIKRLIKYANDEGLDSASFAHPVIKAIFIHFWIGYLHPFTDGNGRIARALFYWYLLRKGYWTMMYLPISSIIKKSRTQYSMAYIYSEQDNYDLTYFYDYNMRKIMQSIEEFINHLKKTLHENKLIERSLNQDTQINDRQKQLIHFLISSKKGASTTTKAHATINQIGRITAAKDLKALKEIGYLKTQKEGSYVHYFATDKLMQLYQKVVEDVD